MLRQFVYEFIVYPSPISTARLQTFVFADNRIGGNICPALAGLKLQVRMGSIVCDVVLVADIPVTVYPRLLCVRCLGLRRQRGEIRTPGVTRVATTNIRLCS